MQNMDRINTKGSQEKTSPKMGFNLITDTKKENPNINFKFVEEKFMASPIEAMQQQPDILLRELSPITD